MIKEELQKKFPYSLKKLRKKRNLTQKELAIRCGIHTSHIGHFESGNRLPSLENLVKLSRALSTTIDSLLGYEAHSVYFKGEEFLNLADRDLIQNLIYQIIKEPKLLRKSEEDEGL